MGISLSLSGPVLADATRFLTTFDASYKVRGDGVTEVTQNFRLTNLTSEFYPSEYVTQINDKEVSNIAAFDELGALPIGVLGGKEGRTKVRIKFNEESLGLGKAIAWTLSYETTAVAAKSGRNWKIFIPRPPEDSEVSDYALGLFVPEEFGRPVVIDPKPTLADNFWRKADLGSLGIRVSYFPDSSDNPHQAYDFKLRYHLENTNLYAVTQEIAIPPDTDRQKVFLTSLSPKPINVFLDGDGNWLAKYQLSGLSRLDVVAEGSATIYLWPQSATPYVDTRPYVEAKSYWESGLASILGLTGRSLSAQEVSQTVVSRLNYRVDGTGSGRAGALNLTSDFAPSSSLDYADFFIALSREMGIPARQLLGVLVGKNRGIGTDLLHSWAEYYDRKSFSWVMVDPERADATGFSDVSVRDTDHFVLAVRGLDSLSPIAPGMYQNRKSGADAEISYSDDNRLPSAQAKYSLRVSLPDVLLSGFPYSGFVYIENNGPTALSPGSLSVSSERLVVSGEKERIERLPPFGRHQIAIAIGAESWSAEFSDIISASFLDARRDVSVKVEPIFKNVAVQIIFFVTVCGILSIASQLARGLFAQGRKRQGPLRR